MFFYFFLNTSEWLFPTITAIVPLFCIFFEKKNSRWNMCNHMLSKGKKEQKLINTNVITNQRYSYVPVSIVVEIQFQIIQTYLLFPVFNLWNYPFCRLILCTWCNFSSSVNFFNSCFATLFLKITEVFL